MTEESESALNEIPASEILDKIQKGEPVKYDHVRIIGNLDVSKLDLPTKHVDRTEYQQARGLLLESKIISSQINIVNSKFEGIVNFSNCVFEENGNFGGASFSKVAYFEGASFRGHADFGGACFDGNALFEGASFSRNALFEGAYFGEMALFKGASFGEGAGFDRASFSRSAGFDRASFSKEAWFIRTCFDGIVWFRGASFGKEAWFIEASFSKETWFNGASFSSNAMFNGASFSGDILTFRYASFADPASQEYVCRKAKNVLEKNGNREEAGLHFYREMEAKRVQKGIRGNSGLGLINCLKTDTWSFQRFLWYDVIEWLFAQVMFGYGVHFERLIASWAVIVVLFASLYYSGDAISGISSVFDYLKVSFATAIAPGYIAVIMNPSNSTGGYRLTSGYYQAAAMVETLLGTFLWAGFIATFAKKYMR